jgi:molecular chaperone GrpE (heat shock protein)
MDHFIFVSCITSLDERAVLHFTAVFIAAALGFFLWWRFRRYAGMPPAPPAEVNEPTMEDDMPETPLNEGPGQLLVRFQTLHQDLEHATQDLQRFNGSREIQLQGWQQLSADVIRRILPVLENLEPYLEDTDSTAADVAQLAYGRLLTELVTIGVTQIIPLPGESFDGRYHVLGTDSVGYPPYRITSVAQPGYRFQPRIPGASEIVLKPAEVIVESETELVDIELVKVDGLVEGDGMAELVEDDGMAELVEEDSISDPVKDNTMMVSLFEQVPAAMVLDDDDVIEIRRMPPPDDDDEDDEDVTEVKRMPSSLPDDE